MIAIVIAIMPGDSGLELPTNMWREAARAKRCHAGWGSVD
jgi:hypothetical protein